MIWLALLGSAWAQEGPVGFDAHGFVLAPDDGDLDDLLMTWRAEEQRPGAVGLQALAEYANAPLVLFHKEGDEVTREPLLDHVFALNLGGHVGVHERVAVGLSAPLYLTSISEETYGPALGDLRLSVPVNLLYEQRPDTAFGLSLVPFGVLPTGPQGRFLGAGAPQAGGLLAVSWMSGALGASANLGAMTGRPLSYENLLGGPRLLTAVGASYAMTEDLALRAEVRFEPALSQNAVAMAESPGEILLSARGHSGANVYWTAGMSSAFTRGASAATFRAFAGVGFVLGKTWARDTDGDGLLDADDTCPEQVETVNAYADDDGCPDQLATVRFRAVDPAGDPIPGATVTVDGEAIGQTGPDGVLTLSERIPGTVEVGASYPEPIYTAPETATVELAEGEQTRDLTFGFVPRAVDFTAKTPEGEPVAATVRVLDAEGGETAALELGEDGAEQTELVPGSFTAEFEAPDKAPEQVTFEVEPGTEAQVVGAVLSPAQVEVTEEKVEVQGQIFFDFDRASIRPVSDPLLDEIAATLTGHPELGRVEIQGHTSDEGTTAYNQDLSQRRAESVRDALVRRGVARDRLVPRGYGESTPLVPNTSQANRERNRRVELVILEREE